MAWAALCASSLAALRVVGGASAVELMRGMSVELCVGKSIPLDWAPGVAEYSLALPRDAPFVAVRVNLRVLEGEVFQERLAMRVPLKDLSFAMLPGEPSDFVEVDTEERTVLKVDVGDAEFTINAIRSRIASNGQVEQPDLARRYPPMGTLSGLALWDSTGRDANMAWFTPRTSSYYASVSGDARGIRLVATPNDPDAELEWRRNGGKWDFLVSGLTSASASISPSSWTLFEVRVRSAAALATKSVGGDPLVYQIAVTRDLVCHPTCRSCRGPSLDECTSCFAPLVLLRGGRCLYTSCQSRGSYFDSELERCLPCAATCVECQDGSTGSCTICPPKLFLLTPSPVHVAGECVPTCPFGYFVQPLSQRCQRAPIGARIEKVYFRLDLRISPEEFSDEAALLSSVLDIAAETLNVSPQDIRFHRWEPSSSGFSVLYYFEVENPFVSKESIKQRTSIDDWFAALPVPVDSIRVLSVNELYPPPLVPKEGLPLPAWLIGAIAAGITGGLVICPLYHFYFIRMHFQKNPYRPHNEQMTLFVDHILKHATDEEVKKLATVSAAKAG